MYNPIIICSYSYSILKFSQKCFQYTASSIAHQQYPSRSSWGPYLSHMNHAARLENGIPAVLWLYSSFYSSCLDINVHHCSVSLRDGKDHTAVLFVSRKLWVTTTAMSDSRKIAMFCISPFLFRLIRYGQLKTAKGISRTFPRRISCTLVRIG